MADAGTPWLLPDWPAPAGVRAVVTTRLVPGSSLPPYEHFNLGLRSGEPPARVRDNRALLARHLALPSVPCWLRQVHGTAVVRAGTGQGGEEPEADAAITDAPGIVLAILTADCLPVLFCSDDGRELGAAHAGWRGLADGVLEATLAAMAVAPERLLAWLGPCIGGAGYEVGADVRQACLAADPGAGGCFVDHRPGHWLCDLAGLARRRLAAAGVSRVYGGGFDTLTDPRFYSYRGEGSASGRFASLLWRA